MKKYEDNKYVWSVLGQWRSRFVAFVSSLASRDHWNDVCVRVCVCVEGKVVVVVGDYYYFWWEGNYGEWRSTRGS